MSGQPESDPLGATPVLPSPQGQRARQANAAFARFGPGASASAGEAETEESRPVSRPTGIVRQYPIARAKVAQEETPWVPDYDESRTDKSGTDETLPGERWAEQGASAPAELEPAEPESGESPADRGVALRPPPGVPVVRPSVAAPAPSNQSLTLPEGAQGDVFIAANPDGSTVFEVALDVANLGPLRCAVSLHQGTVEATFFATDVNLRRLLEAEAPHLRDALSARGLSVSAVRVELSAEQK